MEKDDGDGDGDGDEEEDTFSPSGFRRFFFFFKEKYKELTRSVRIQLHHNE